MKNKKLLLICEDPDCGFVTQYAEKDHNGKCPHCDESLEIIDHEEYETMNPPNNIKGEKNGTRSNKSFDRAKRASVLSDK